MITGKPRKITASITIDANRSRSVDMSDAVLLYDESNGCYYMASLSAMVARIERKYAEEMVSYKAKLDVALAEIKQEQRKFIEETAKVNDAMLAMIKENMNHE